MFFIGHRGARISATENTMAAFRSAFEKKLSMVELDVQLTKDGHLIVLHDPTLDRTTNGKGFVFEMTLNEIQQFQTPEGESVPALEEVLLFCRGKMKVLIEIKAMNCTEKIAQLIQKLDMQKEIIVQSFLHHELFEYRKYDQKTPTAPLFDEIVLDPRSLGNYLEALGANGANLKFSSIYERLVEEMHQNNFFVFAWGISSKESKKFSLIESLQVDGAILAF